MGAPWATRASSAKANAITSIGEVKDKAHKVKKAVERKIDDTLDEMEDDRGPGRTNG